MIHTNSHTQWFSSTVLSSLVLLALLCGACPHSMRRRSSNASVTSGKTSHVFHAVFLPLPLNAETVSHPVMHGRQGELHKFWDPSQQQHHEFRTASATCTKRRVSASSWEQEAILLTSAAAKEHNTSVPMVE